MSAPRPDRRLVALVATAFVAADRGARGCAAAPPPAPKFDGGRAFEDLRQMVTFGPRPAGLAGARKHARLHQASSSRPPA